MKPLISTYLTALMAIGLLHLSSCREEGPDVVTPAVADIVTFIDNNDTGALLEFRQIDDSPLITLQCDTEIDTAKVEPGSRIYASYVPVDGNAYASGDIRLLSYAPINSDKLRVGRIADFPDWQRDGVYLFSLWRTGSYINVFCRLTYDTAPRTFMLLADKASMTQEVVDVYLVHQLQKPTNSFERQYYASFDISALWDRENLKAIRVHLANTNVASLTTFTFEK